MELQLKESCLKYKQPWFSSTEQIENITWENHEFAQNKHMKK